MEFVREKTTIPVPEVYNVYTDKETGHTRIMMEFIDGVELEEAWDNYSQEEKVSVIEQLRGYMEQLRKIKGTFIGPVDGSWCDDPFFDARRGTYGPYKDEQEFNMGIIRALHRDKPSISVDLVGDIWLNEMKGHEIVFTHNDFAPRNILVQGAKVVAIIDWELSGFYPDYWEYCKALRQPDWDSGWIRERALDKILKPWMRELSVMWNTTDIIW
ncbi:putative phosphotransferase enzyme family protein [Rosellinia necatrix]|uniref:Putative phosphotransferase enzyme family protein n=1 Tax=Rosellinia necatrix TaxID=77044 RepID=A0A1W2TT14_ROSNE|nr:putative phosphotransferase enzyme family protein [Rosellinia necatrix]